MKVAIFTEDRYGIGFVKGVIVRLKNEGFIKNIVFARTYTPALIKKCHNVRKVKSVVKDVDKVIIIVDKENESEYDEYEEIWRHLKNLGDEDKKKIAVIAAEPCIEEWICTSLGLEFDGSGFNADKKPDRILKENRGYRKSDLPNYVRDLDFDKLLKSSRSFSELVEHLKA